MEEQKKKITKNKALIDALKKYWERFKDAEAKYSHDLAKIEGDMQQEFKDGDFEFFHVDGSCVGIGTPANPERLKLVTREELE
jgi:hypothetical protein